MQKLIKGTFLFALALFLAVGLLIALGCFGDVYKITEGTLRVSDFSYHMLVFKAWWLGDIGNVYLVEDQQLALSSFFGIKIPGAMPIGMTFPAPLLFLPFIYLSQYTLAVSQAVWVIICLSLLIFVILQTLLNCHQRLKRIPFGVLAVLVIVVFSDVAQRALLLGQTSVLAAATLILLFFEFEKVKERLRLEQFIFLLILLCYLAVKPPYFFLGMLVLIAYRQWKLLISSLLVLSILSFIMIVSSSEMLLASYFQSMAIYTWDSVPNIYKQSIQWQELNLFHNAAGFFLDEQLARRLGAVIYISVSLYALVATISSSHRKSIEESKQYGAFYFTLALSSYLLFAPYAALTEELLVFIPLVVLACIFIRKESTMLISILIPLATFIVLNTLLLGFDKETAGIFWLVKFVLLFGLLYYTKPILLKPASENNIS